MISRHKVDSYEDFQNLMKTLENKLVIVYFTSYWCPFCEITWPTLDANLEKHHKQDFHFVRVEIGDPHTWRDKQNPYRIDPKIKLKMLPSVLKWNSHKKLEGDHCRNHDTLDMLYEEDDD